MDRSANGRYEDPLDVVWLACAARIGLAVVRSDEAWAAWDGAGTLTLCTPAAFDPDDSLAQLVLHEICHALVQGRPRQSRRDWGLEDEPDVAVAEHACHRLQAALAAAYGLREVLAVTTDWRPYWDSLPDDPLAPGPDPAIERARTGWALARRGPWAEALHAALDATARLADVARSVAPPDSLWARYRGRNPLGVGLRAEPGATCGGCAWGADGVCRANGTEGLRAPAVAPGWAACLRWEPRLDEAACAACGACCREAYDAVSVEAGDVVHDLRPELVTTRLGVQVLPRPGGRCVGLEPEGPPWRCAIYAIRPRSCREFEAGGASCHSARTRLGLSRS